MSNRNLIPGEPFKMVSLQKTRPSDRLHGADWFRYVIGQGTNQIEGYRQGSCESVTQAVELMVLQLNDRRMGKFGTSRTRPTAKK